MSEAGALKEEAARVLVHSKSLSQRTATWGNRIVGESDAFTVEIKSLQQSISAAEKSIRAAKSADEVKEATAAVLEAKSVLQGLGPGGDLRKFLKPRNPLLIRLLLGDKINLVSLRRDQSMALKEDYYRFRDRSAWMLLLGPLTLYLGLQRADAVRVGAPVGQYTLTPWLMTGAQAYMAYMSYFYLALALREAVLLVNGSHIRAWWVQHHYWSAAASLVMLGLPVNSAAVQGFFRYFLLWSCFQAGVMFLQNLYQRRRMYTRIALGKNSAMDVVAGESSGASGQLFILYPLLFGLQLWQFAIGAGVAYKTFPAILSPEGWLEMEPAETDLRGMRGVCVVGATFAFMAYRNFATTLSTMMQKRRYISGMKDSSKKSEPKAPAVDKVPGGSKGSLPSAGKLGSDVSARTAAQSKKAIDQ